MKLIFGSSAIVALPRHLPPPHKGLKSPKRFTNLPLVLMSSNLDLTGSILSYGYPGVPQTPRDYKALIEVFKFI